MLVVHYLLVKKEISVDSECLTRVDSMSNMVVVLWEAETS
jgi:hypothetical protein